MGFLDRLAKTSGEQAVEQGPYSPLPKEDKAAREMGWRQRQIEKMEAKKAARKAAGGRGLLAEFESMANPRLANMHQTRLLQEIAENQRRLLKEIAEAKDPKP